tara:strand:+ start:8349 stop:8732 length:384 start_codon:yes stop_codon:yes gene_type:complete
MAVTVSNIADPLGSKLIIDADSNATAEDDVTGASSTIIYAVEITNSDNQTPVYTKLADTGDATSGTTNPYDMVKVASGSKETYIIGTGLSYGNLSFWTVLSPYTFTADNTGADDPPASPVQVKILCT